MLRVVPGEIPVSKLHGYLLGAVAPRPIAFASTIDKEGLPNLAPFSFFNVFSSNPPIAIFSPARSGRTAQSKHTFDNVKDVPEVVINAVSYDMVHQTSLASTEYPKGVSEFKKAGFTPIASESVKPFRVKESPVQMECRVRQVVELGDKGGAGNLIICEIILIHIADQVLDANGMIDPHKIDLVARMGRDFYCRASGNAVFEVQKPIERLGIGIDSIPQNIRNSKILSGNDLGRLGNVESLPGEDVVREYKTQHLIGIFTKFAPDKNSLEDELHKTAKELLQKGNVDEAWMVLLSMESRVDK